MTAPATTRRAGPFNGNGVTTSFPFTFKVFATSDIAVTKTVDGIDTVLALGSDYTVALNPDQDTSPGGTITYPVSGSPLAASQTLVAVGSLPYDQTADLPSGGNYRAIVIENALDRTVMQVQQLVEELGRSLTLSPSSAGADTELPAPEANKVIGWNAAADGLVNLDASDLASVVVAGTAYTDIFNGTGAQVAFTLTANPGNVNALDIAISGVSQVNGVDFTVSGTTLTFTSAPPAATGNICVRYVAAVPVGSANAQDVTYLPAGAGAVATTAQSKMRESVSVFDFFTASQVSAVQAYTYSTDITSAVQVAMTAAQSSGRALYCPAGGYLVTGLTIPGVNTTQGKANRFCMYGDSFGEAGVIALQNRGTVFKSVTNAPIFDYQATVAGDGCGDIEISHIAMWGDSSTPVINIETLFGNSNLHHLTLVQSGTGDGIKIGWGATYEIYSSYITGASYAVASGLGAARTGLGVCLAQDTRSGGLQTVRKVTAAGWHTCIKVGAGATGAYTYAPMIDTCEMAFYYRGVHFTEDCESGTLSQCYFEGQDTGIGVLDEGNYNRVRDSLFFFNGTGNTFIDSLKPAKFGSRYTGNVFYLFNGATSTGVDIRSNAVAGGPAKVVEDNHFVLSAGTANVVGIKLQGVDPRVHLAGNDFQPAGAWTGSGTSKIADTSTSSDTTAGSARYGFGFAQSLDGSLTVPSVGRGSVNLEVEPLARNNTHIAAGVLMLGELSVFTLTPTGNVAITGFAAPNLPGKTFSIHVTATAFAVTFTNGALLKLAGSANLVTGANGCWISFQIKAGGVTWETGRVVY